MQGKYFFRECLEAAEANVIYNLHPNLKHQNNLIKLKNVNKLYRVIITMDAFNHAQILI